MIMTRYLSLLLSILLNLPAHAGDPPKDLLAIFEATRFDKVDRLEGLPGHVRQAAHDLLKRQCDALQEQMKRDLKDTVEQDPAWRALSKKEQEEFFQNDTPGIADPGGKWCATDVIREHKLPRRRLLFAGSSPTLWFIYYEHGGVGRHEHLLLIGKDATGAYWTRWVRNPHLGEKGIGMARLKRLVARGRLATSEEDTGE